MKYEKCPICEEKLRKGICPMCGYDFNRLGQSKTSKEGHKDFKSVSNKKSKKPKYKSPSREKKKAKNFFWALGVIVVIISWISEIPSQDLHDILGILKKIISSWF